MNLDVISNREAILAACEHVRTSHEDCPWIVLGYSALSPHPGVYTIIITTNGTTWKDFLLALYVDKILYAYLKLDAAIVDKSFTPQTHFLLILIHWTGERVPVNEKSIYSRHTEKICDLFGEYHCMLMCSSVIDILTNIDVLDCKDSFLRFKALHENKSGVNLREIPSKRVVMVVNILGDTNCGKTSFAFFIQNGYFIPKHSPTIGTSLWIIQCRYKKAEIQLKIMDNNGLDLMHPYIYNFSVFRRGSCIVLFYDITQRTSFLNIRERMMLVRKHADPSVCIMLLGNKMDLEDQRDVTFEEGEDLAKELGIHCFFEISVQNGTNVNDAWNSFNLLMGINFNKEITDKQAPADTIEPGNDITPQRKPCCKKI